MTNFVDALEQCLSRAQAVGVQSPTWLLHAASTRRR